MSTALEIIKIKKEEAFKKIQTKIGNAKKKVYVGMATCEIAAGSMEVMDVFKDAMKNGLKDVYLSQKGCVGRCNLEPTVEIYEQGKMPIKYVQVDKNAAIRIVEEHLKNGKVVEEFRSK